MRFRCVCKSWYGLVKDPFFLSMHLDNYTQSSSSTSTDAFAHLLISCCKYQIMDGPIISLLSWKNKNNAIDPATMAKTDLKISQLLNSKYFSYPSVVDNCNGIVCLHGCFENIALWNPTIREFKILPVSSVSLPWNIFSRHVGFGYDAKANDYKVVQIFSGVAGNFNSPGRHKVEVYTLSTNSWKIVDNVMPDRMNFHAARGISCVNNRFICWWLHSQQVDVILSFDVQNEVFQTTKLPQSIIDHSRYCLIYANIVPFNDAIVLVAFSPLNFQDVRVWLMNKLGDQESRTRFLSRILPFTYIDTPLGSWKKGHKFILKKTLDGVIYYEPHGSVMEDIIGLQGKVTVYKDSLVFIDGNVYAQ